MAYKLIYTAQLVQVDNTGNPDGFSYSFTGAQGIAVASPQSADLTTAATAMGADIAAKMIAAFPTEALNTGD